MFNISLAELSQAIDVLARVCDQVETRATVSPNHQRMAYAFCAAYEHMVAYEYEVKVNGRVPDDALDMPRVASATPTCEHC